MRLPAAIPTTALRVSLACSAIALLAACTGELNRSVGPVGASLPDLGAAATPVAEGVPAVRDESWRFNEIDRASWDVVVIAAPRGQVETNPAPDFTPKVMVGRGASSESMPTAESAVIVDSDGGRVALEGLADPFRAAWSLIESPYGLFARPPWSVVNAPTADAYEVLQHTATPIAASEAPEAPVGE